MEDHTVPTPPNCVHPAILRAQIKSQIGKDCPFPTVASAARYYGVNEEQLRMYVRGKRPAEPKLCRAFGVVPVTFYLPAKAIEARQGGDGTAPSQDESAVRQHSPEGPDHDQ